MKAFIEAENDLYTIFDEIITRAQLTMPHPSGIDFVTHKHGEVELINDLMMRSMEVVKKHFSPKQQAMTLSSPAPCMVGGRKCETCGFDCPLR